MSNIKFRKCDNYQLFCRNLFSCLCTSDKRKIKNKAFRMYVDGQDRIEKEFDIVNIVQNLRKFTIILKREMKDY